MPVVDGSAPVICPIASLPVARITSTPMLRLPSTRMPCAVPGPGTLRPGIGVPGIDMRGIVGLDRPALDRLASDTPFHGRLALRAVHAFHWTARPGVVACVPARDEAERLPASLDALRASLGRVDEPVAIVVLVNNSTDGSVPRVRDWAARTDAPVLIVETELDDEIADAGHARRLALDLGALVATPDAVLLTTDADTRVARDWARRLVGHVRAGAGAAAGMIDVEPDEFAALPSRVREIERAERALFREHARTWRLLVPEAPLALALRVGGASLAVSARAYRRVGRLPPLAVSEDRAMVAAMLRHDERVVFAARAAIRTSCRLHARVADGMAGTLRERMERNDPVCDQDLHGAVRFAWLCLAWRQVCHRHAGTGSPDDAAPIARALGVDDGSLEPRPGETRGEAWERLIVAAPPAPRLRASEVGRERAAARSLRRVLRSVGPAAPIRAHAASLSLCDAGHLKGAHHA